LYQYLAQLSQRNDITLRSISVLKCKNVYKTLHKRVFIQTSVCVYVPLKRKFVTREFNIRKNRNRNFI